MRNSPLERNRAYALLRTLFHAVVSAFSSVSLFVRAAFGKTSPEPLPPNRFFEALHFLFVSGPRHFWKKPTGIAAGRSVGTFLHFLLERDRFAEKKSKKGFTLIEVMISITILSMLFIYGLQSMGQIGAYRTNVSNRIDLGQDLYYNVERLVGIVKEGGTVDYEEYWNRMAVGTGMADGHYSVPTGFGNYATDGTVGTANFGTGHYSCVSGSGTAMGTGGCLASFNSIGASQEGKPQRYGQYALQFVDYNSNADGDGGDENGDGALSNDEDDEDLGMGPAAFEAGTALKELYLIKKRSATPERLILRWNVAPDPNRGSGSTCTVSATGAATGGGCLGRLEMLRLVGRDYGFSHSGAVASAGSFDGRIDTWECRSDFYCAGNENTPVGTGSSFGTGTTEWVSVFPEDINVVAVNFHPYPNKDYKLSWKESDPSIRVAPYVRIDLTLGFAWSRRKKIEGYDPKANVTTTVSLSE